jgi:phage terminase small subunit
VDKLTTKQKLFVESYLADPNATQAAIKAGYSKHTAKSQGQRLLTNVDIKQAVEKRIEKAVMSADEVLTELANIAVGNYETYRGDKLRALELVGKYHKLFTDKLEHSGKDGGPIQQKIVVEFIDG